VSGRWVDLREAAELLGTSTEAVRKRATRGSLRSERHDGRVVVWVDDGRTEGGREAQGETSADGGALVEALTEQVSYLKAQLDIRTEELREHRRLLAGLIERVPELEAPAETSVPSQSSEESAQDAANGVGGGGPHLASDAGTQNGSERVSWWRRVFGG
jgi:hypothetical protein